MADGGEGTVESLVLNTSGKFVEVEVTAPILDKVNAKYGILGDGNTGVKGQTVYGLGYGVIGINQSVSAVDNNIGVSGEGSYVGVYGQTSDPAGFGVYSNGNFAASGTKAFIIDHPTDPENKNLKHFCMESPEVLNLYR
jgi:hypothetical protein